MQLTSQDLTEGQTMPLRHVYNGMGYQGENISPHLAWQNVPEGTQSFVVTCFDPDAPTGSGWWHWVVANIPVTVTELPQGAGSNRPTLPEGAIQTRTDFGKSGYDGAAPPNASTHRYVFTVHALKAKRIDVDETSSGAMVGLNIYTHSLGNASLTVTFC